MTLPFCITIRDLPKASIICSSMIINKNKALKV